MPEDQRPRGRGLGALAGRIYGTWVWAVTIAIGIVVWPLVQVLPSLRARWALVRLAGRVIRLAAASRLSVRGTPPRDGPLVIIANHSSYIDGFILICAMARPVTFAVGGPLARQRIAGPFLRAIGCTFVGIESGRPPSAQLEDLTGALRQGKILGVFPEGSLGTAPGLRKFHIGAFLVAAQVGCGVIPVAIDGTRALLPPGRRMPRRGSASVAFGAAITPGREGFASAHELSSRSREAIAALLEHRR